MAELKTKPTSASVTAFLKAIDNPTRAEDARTIKSLMERLTGEKPKMWGPSIIGFGNYHYKYDSGHEGDFFITGFSPRKKALTLYIMPGFGRYDDLMARLGKYKTGKSCLYINKLSDVDMAVLEELIASSYAWMRENYGS